MTKKERNALRFAVNRVVEARVTLATAELSKLPTVGDLKECVIKAQKHLDTVFELLSISESTYYKDRRSNGHANDATHPLRHRM